MSYHLAAMVHVATIVGSAAAALALTLYFERRKQTAGKVVAKTVTSSLFVLAALVQPDPMPAYFHPLLVGLLLCLVGDLCLALPGKRTFLAGLVAFLLGHCAYVVAFTAAAPICPTTLVGLLVAGSASTAVFAWLRPRLGRMRRPVAAYVVVITLMVASASSALASEMSLAARALVVSGALAFYLSDLFVARDRFVSEGFVNRLVGLPLYYAGQLLLAFSVGVVR